MSAACVRSSQSDPATRLAENAEVAAAAHFVAALTSATNALTY